MGRAPLLHRKVERLPVRRPSRGALPVVDAGIDLASMRAVGIHDPDVGVFHGGLGGSQRPSRALISDRFAGGRPDRPVLGIFGVGKAADGPAGLVGGENVVVEDAIRIRLVVGDKQDLASIRRPVDRVLVEISGSKLAHGFRRDIDDEDMQPPVVVEPRRPLRCRRLIEVARNHHGIAVCVRLRPRRRRNERDRFGIRRPRQPVPRAGQRMIAPGYLCQQDAARSVRT